jgi:hypothetical protein
MSLYENRNDDPHAIDDALVVSFFVDHYVDQRVASSTRRTFIFVDISDDCGPTYLRDLLSYLSQLAKNSDFSICVASGHPLGIVAENSIDIDMHLRNDDDILRYVNINLVAEWEERNRTVVRIGEKARGIFLWAEIVVNILNAAINDGACQEVIEYTVEEIPGDLHGLYEWMLGTLNKREKEEALALFQWVILAAEPMRLNDLWIAVRLTRAWSFDTFRPEMVLQQHGAPLSMSELRKIRNSDITTDTPYQFRRWIRSRSIGLLELRSERPDGGVVNEPWGLQRVQVTHDSVRTFFLSGRGFACLADDPVAAACRSTEEHIDMAHYSLLHACLTYLNMRDFEHLGRATASSKANSNSPRAFPLSPGAGSNINSSSSNYWPGSPSSATTSAWSPVSAGTSGWSPVSASTAAWSPISSSSSTWSPSSATSAWSPPMPPSSPATPISLPSCHSSVMDQRRMIVSSYPFLDYAVRHLLFHLLAPPTFRYFLPQNDLLRAFAANRCRLWCRWTALLGTADADRILAAHDDGPAKRMLSPVVGSRYRLQRIFRTLARIASGDAGLVPTAMSDMEGARKREDHHHNTRDAEARSCWEARRGMIGGRMAATTNAAATAGKGVAEKMRKIQQMARDKAADQFRGPGTHDSRRFGVLLGLAKWETGM